MAWVTVSSNEVALNSFISTGNNNSISTALAVGNTPGTIFVPIYTELGAIQQRLKTLLSTRIGERIMHPTYGTDLYRILFEPNISELKQQISQLVTIPIGIWIPDVNIQNLDIVTNEDDPNLDHIVRITLSYSVGGFDSNSIVIYLNNDNTIVVTE